MKVSSDLPILRAESQTATASTSTPLTQARRHGFLSNEITLQRVQVDAPLAHQIISARRKPDLLRASQRQCRMCSFEWQKPLLQMRLRCIKPSAFRANVQPNLTAQRSVLRITACFEYVARMGVSGATSQGLKHREGPQVPKQRAASLSGLGAMAVRRLLDFSDTKPLSRDWLVYSIKSQGRTMLRNMCLYAGKT